MDSLLSYLQKALVMLAIMLAPIQAVMLTVGFLIFLDLATGIWAALKRQEKISSAALRRTLSKMIIYQLAIISGFLIEHHIVGDSIPMIKILAGFISLVELKSILENSNVILGANVFKLLIRKLGSKNDQL